MVKELLLAVQPEGQRDDDGGGGGDVVGLGYDDGGARADLARFERWVADLEKFGFPRLVYGDDDGGGGCQISTRSA